MTINCSLDARIYAINNLTSAAKDTQSPSDGGGNSEPPELGSISFSLPSSFFKVQDPVNLHPIKTAGCSDFTISPYLPSGLSIDFNTGVVTGAAVDGALKQVYTVSAKDANGNIITTTIEFEIAKYFLVNTFSDSGDALLGNRVCADSVGNCSIRAALEEAKALGASQLTYVDIPMGDYGVDNLPLSIESRVILKGAGAAVVSLNGNKDGTNVANIITTTAAAEDVTIDGMTIKNASVSLMTTIVGGLGINSVSKNLTLKNCAIRDNSISGVVTLVTGIGLNHVSTGDLRISNCLIANNTLSSSPSFAQGAGINVSAANVFISDVEISSNLFPIGSGSSYGGGAALSATNLISIEKILVTLNQARHRASGMMLQGKTTIINSTFKNNVGALNIFGNELHLSGNFAYDISNSLIQQDSGQQLIYASGGSLNLVNTTVSSGAMAIYSSNTQINFNSSTLSVGVSPAFVFPGSNTTGNISFKNSIINFTGPYHVGSTNPSYSSLGYNVFSNAGLPVGTNAPNDLLNTDPLLDVLASNGGATQTMALLSSSPAKNIIPIASCLPADQRGQSRTAGAFCDAGAYQH